MLRVWGACLGGCLEEAADDQAWRSLGSLGQRRLLARPRPLSPSPRWPGLGRDARGAGAALGAVLSGWKRVLRAAGRPRLAQAPRVGAVRAQAPLASTVPGAVRVGAAAAPSVPPPGLGRGGLPDPTPPPAGQLPSGALLWPAPPGPWGTSQSPSAIPGPEVPRSPGHPLPRADPFLALLVSQSSTATGQVTAHSVV